MSNVCVYMNTTIRTIYFTSYLNTILTILKLNSSIYENTIIITFNNTINFYSISITLYSTRFLLNKSCLLSLNSSRHLINTIYSFFITNSSIRYINTTIRTIYFTIYRNTIRTVFKLNTFIYWNTISFTYNNTWNRYTSTTTSYSWGLTILIKAYLSSLYLSRSLLNTIFSICITNSSRYLNTTNRTSNCTSCVYSISTTIYRTLLQKSRCFSLYCWRNILINTIWRICLVSFSNITNSSIYINTTIRTFNCTIYKNTIFIIFKLSICIYYNTITAICVVTLNITINLYSTSCTIYITRLLINTIWRICLVSFSNMTNSSIYINTTIRTFNCTIQINTISFTFNSTDNWYSRITTLNSSKRLINTILSIFSITNSSSYLNSTSFTCNSALNWNSIIITIYSTLLIETIECPLYSSRLLPNTI